VNFVVRLTTRALQRAGYDYFHEMKLYDESDRASIEIGLKRVFGWGNDGEDRINAAIEGHLHLLPVVNVHLLSIHPVLPKESSLRIFLGYVTFCLHIPHLLSCFDGLLLV
jgi:hypothetical protein